MTAIGGLIPIVATPYDDDGSLDLGSLSALVDFLVASGADGLGLLGLASEAFALTEEERRTIVRTVRHATPPDLPLVVGAGGGATRPAIEQATAVADLGADALMVMAPHPVSAPREGLAEYFQSIAEAADLPVVIQDAPKITGSPLGLEVIAAASAHDLVTHVKVETQPTAQQVSALVEHVGDQVSVLGGQNALYCWEELDRGATGTMPACEFTDLLRTMLDQRAAGDLATARARFHDLVPVLRYGLQSGIAWAIHKHVLVRRGLIATPSVRWPARPLDRTTIDELEGLLDLLDLATT